MTLSLFPDFVFETPKTEGIKYAGSKLRLLPYILQMINKTPSRVVMDGFAGTTRVSQALAKMGYTVLCNDKSVWSKVFGLCYLKNEHPKEYYEPIIQHLNALPGENGWFTEHYGGDGQKEAKRPWQIHNTQKLDAIRKEIDNLKLSEVETAVLLTSLILAMDEVDNTLGHYAAYLNRWSARSYSSMRMRVPSLPTNTGNHQVYHQDIFDLTEQVAPDLAYYDPPYGSNNEKMPPSRVRYAAYYHLWTTICLNDQPEVFGKANRRVDSSDTIASSTFESFKKNQQGRFEALEAIDKLIRQTRAHFILLSYSSGGRATASELQQILCAAGEVIDFRKINYRKNVMASMRWTNEWLNENEEENFEYLFLLQK